MGSDAQKKDERTLLQELCGADAALYACLSTRLYFNPSAAISRKGLDILTKEAERSGDFRPPLDRVIFEGAQNPAESDKYVQDIRDLASRAILSTEREKETALKEGRTALAESLEKRNEHQRVLRDRAGDILRIASQFYSEVLIATEEDARREERLQEKRSAEREEGRLEDREKAGRRAGEKAQRGLGRRERKEAKREARTEERAAEARKSARRDEKGVIEKEEERIAGLEKEGREARRDERKGK